MSNYSRYITSTAALAPLHGCWQREDKYKVPKRHDSLKTVISQERTLSSLKFTSDDFLCTFLTARRVTSAMLLCCCYRRNESRVALKANEGKAYNKCITSALQYWKAVFFVFFSFCDSHLPHLHTTAIDVAEINSLAELSGPNSLNYVVCNLADRGQRSEGGRLCGIKHPNESMTLNTEALVAALFKKK